MGQKYKIASLKFERKRTLLNLGLAVLVKLLVVFSGYAQVSTLSGKITDKNTGEPIFGAIIIVKGTSNGTSTDFDGNYSIANVKSDDVLRVSFIGYETTEVAVGNRSELSFALESSTSDLGEFVVVGYGIQEKRNLTGSIGSVSSEIATQSNFQDPLSLLQGRLAGVQITSNSGAPGGGISINVRGNTSLNAGNSPLFIVDGVPIETNVTSSLNGTENFGLNPLNDINPSDIESIEVLRDAASTAIYGSRAANGVVMITTKRGKKGKPQVSINMFSGVSTVTRNLPVLNASQWRSAVIDSYINANSREEIIPLVLDSLAPANNGDFDWQSELFRAARQDNVDFSIRGGSDNIRYAWSTSYLNQDGIILNSNLTRITSRLNVDFDVSDRLTIGQSVSFSNAVNNRINAAGSGNLSIVREALIRPPSMSMFFPDGSLNGFQLGRRNPVGLAELSTNLNKSNRIIANQYAEVKILEGLKFRSNIHIDFWSMKENTFIPSVLDFREGFNTGSVRSSNNVTWANENILTYQKQFAGSHNFGALAGFSFQDWNYERTGLDGQFFVSDNIRTLNSAGVISNQGVNIITEHSLLSYFSRLTYDFERKYLFEVNARADGSSRFGRDNRFGFFPSAALGWRFSDEGFFDNITFVNDGKLRFSAGQTGNEAIGNYVAQGEFIVGTNYLDFSGASPSVMPNAGLTWETTTQYNAGLDLVLWNNKVILNADAYVKNTRDLLFNVPIPRETGFDFITQNIGRIQNKGIEFTLQTNNIQKNIFSWSSGFNISANRNVIQELPESLLTNGFIQNGQFHILKEGYPIGTFFGWRFDGVFARDEDNVNGLRNGAQGAVFRGGDPIWHDVNGDNIIDQNDRQVIGDATPLFFGGINNDFTYKNFSLNVFFQFSYGNDIYSEINHQRNSIVRYNNLSTDALNRWRQQGDVTNFPAPVRDDPLQSMSRVQSRWVEDGSFIRLRNVHLRYSVPYNVLSRLKIAKLDAYITGTNLITWTRYTGYDPDVNSYSGLRIGVDEGSFPQSRTIILGLNIGL